MSSPSDADPVESTARQAFYEYLDAKRRGASVDADVLAQGLESVAREEFGRILADYQSLRSHLQPLRASLMADRLLGRYRLIEELGRGGMGVVWEAEHVSLVRRVALKILHPHLGWSAASLERFRREGLAAARLTHPAAVTVFEVGEGQDCHYIAQELVPGGLTLADSIAEARERGSTPPGYYRTRAEQFALVADALEAAHRLGIVHRDVKPGNILMTSAGQPKLADFGLAMLEDQVGLSRTGEAVGTPYYMSPEQTSGRRLAIDHRTDVFSLGATLYEALTLERPFEGTSMQEIVQEILLRDPPDPRQRRSDVPRDLALICLKAIEKKPERRYATIALLADDLRRYLRHEVIAARPPPALGRFARWCRRNPVRAVLGVAAAATVCMLVAVLRTKADDLAKTRRLVALLQSALEMSVPGRRNGPEQRRVANELVAFADEHLQSEELEYVRAKTVAAELLLEAGGPREALDVQKDATDAASELGNDDCDDTLRALQNVILVGDVLDEFHGSQRAADEGLELSKTCVDCDPELRRFFLRRLYLSLVREENWERVRALDAQYGSLERMLLEQLQLSTAVNADSSSITALSDLANLYLYEERWKEAEQAFEQLREAQSRFEPPLSRALLATRLNLAISVARQPDRRREGLGALAAAHADLERGLGASSVLTLLACRRIGATLLDLGEHRDAVQWYTRAEEGMEHVLGCRHLDVLNVRVGIALIHMHLGDTDRAEREIRAVIDDFESLFGRDHTQTLFAVRALVQVLLKQARYAEARPLAEDSVLRFERIARPSSNSTFEARGFLAMVYHGLGECELEEQQRRRNVFDRRDRGQDAHVEECDLEGFFDEHPNRRSMQASAVSAQEEAEPCGSGPSAKTR